MRFIFCLLLLTATDAAAQEVLPADKSVTFELKPGEEKEFTYTATVDGEASVWARSEHLDVALEVLEEDGDFEEIDDDSGGGKAAHMYVRVRKDTDYVVIVTAKERAKNLEGDGDSASMNASTTSVTCAAIEAPIDERTSAMTKRLQEVAVDMQALLDVGDYEGARMRGREEDLRDLEATSRWPLSVTLATYHLGSRAYESKDPGWAKACWELVIAMRERTLPADHLDLLHARSNLAITLSQLGNLHAAYRLQVQVLAITERTLPADDPRLQTARGNFAVTLSELGELSGARRLQEQVLAVLERTLPADDPQLQTARGCLAVTLRSQGELATARSLQEQVLAVFERTLPSDHPQLQTARGNLAGTLRAQGELVIARGLAEKVLAAMERTLSEDHLDLQDARANLALTLLHLGELPEVRKLEEQVLAVRERTLPAEHPDLQHARSNLATTLLILGELSASCRLQEHLLAVRERTLPADHPDLHIARSNFATTLSALAAEVPDEFDGRLTDHLTRYSRITNESLEQSIESLSDRQIGNRAASVRVVLSHVHSAWDGDKFDGDEILELTERLRGLASRSRKLVRSRGEAPDDEVEERSREVVSRRRKLADFLAKPEVDGAAEGETVTTRLAALVRAKEQAEIALTKALMKRPESAALVRPVGVAEIAAALPQDSVAVSFSEYVRRSPTRTPEGRITWSEESHVVAMTLASNGAVTRIDLGPAARIERAVHAWRGLIGAPVGRGIEPEDEEVGVAEVARRLRALLLDPVLAVLGDDVKRLVVTLSDDMHLVPLDALPLEDGRSLGDAYQIDVVGCLEWLARKTSAEINASGFVAFGSVDYLGKAKPLEDSPEPIMTARGNPKWKRDFRDLPFTEIEVRTLEKTYRRAFEDEEGHVAAQVFTDREVDKARIRRFAPRARYLHLATHGWFAPESIPSILDRRELEGVASPLVSDFRNEVRGYLPLELCGLALTGANLPPGKDGSRPGLLTGTEIANFDLDGVELAVLSACETNVGITRAGQGIMSLQEALASAGVRYSLTSLWRVPDEATMELMTRFYEGIWRRGETKHEALWKAKLKLRDAKDPRTGKPRHGLKDWAGWVLYGNPE